MSETEKIERIREQLPVTRRMAYFNTGSVGPLPVRATETIAAWVRRELDEGRIGVEAMQAANEVRARARAAVAGVIGAEPDEIALTHHTTEGINVVLWGLDWQPGDELVRTNLEHPAVFLPAFAVERRFGAKVVVADLGSGGGDVVEAFAKALSPRTRVVALSHVAYCTGAALPVAEIARLAHEQGALVLVDGAQAAGAVPVDVKSLDADFYAVPGQKWLCGPEDTGALYVRRNRLESVQQTFVGYASMATLTYGEPLIPQPDARRFEVGSRHTPSLAGQAASIEWIKEEVGFSWAYARIAHLVAVARERLGDIPGVEIISPSNAAGLLSFAVAGVDAEALSRRLNAQGIVIRWIRAPRCARASFGFFNTEEDVDRLVAAVAGEARAS
jgi:L-cysteine/cystine lyase